MRSLLVILVFTVSLRGQQTDPEPLIREIETSILSRDLVAAYDFAARLDENLHAILREAQARDPKFIASQVLTWLPPASDTFVFEQQPGSKAVAGSGRLAGLRGGAVAGALRGITVRLAAAGGDAGVPGSLAYFYFFDSNVNARALGAPDLTILGRPFWSAALTGNEAASNDWFTLARPDLLIVAGSRELAAGILGRVLNGSSTRALRADLPEWREVNRDAAMWGLRHLSQGGLAVSMDAAGKVEIRCQCEGRPEVPNTEFQSTQVRNGLWVLRGDAEALSSAFRLLGLGGASR